MPARTGRVAAAALAGVLALSGCQQVRQALGGASEEALVEAVSLTEQDAGPSAQFQLIPGGDQVAGQVSLDLCQGDFPSEALRVARRQVALQDESGAWLSSEAVLYGSPEQAEQAMAELARAQRDCPTGQVDDGQGEAATWRFSPAPDGDWAQEPGVARQAYAFTVTPTGGQAWRSTATYLQRGRMVLGLYAAPPDSNADLVRNSPDAARFVSVMSRRLASLPQAALETTRTVDDEQDPNDLEA